MRGTLRSSLLAVLLWSCQPPPTSRAPVAAPTPARVAQDPGPTSAPARRGDAPAPTSQPRPPRLPSGSLDPREVRAVIDGHVARLQRCHRAHARWPRRKVSALMWVLIGADGKVKALRLEEAPGLEPPVERCLRGEIQRWIFPRPRGGEVVVHEPLYLQALPLAKPPAK